MLSLFSGALASIGGRGTSCVEGAVIGGGDIAFDGTSALALPTGPAGTTGGAGAVASTELELTTLGVFAFAVGLSDRLAVIAGSSLGALEFMEPPPRNSPNRAKLNASADQPQIGAKLKHARLVKDLRLTDLAQGIVGKSDFKDRERQGDAVATHLSPIGAGTWIQHRHLL
jgi:hypothetical protein